MFFDLARQSAPNVPLHAVGVSWGGKLAVAAALLHPADLDSILLVAPGLAQKVDISAREKARVLLCRLFRPTARFDIPIERPEMFTSNPERIRFMYGDTRMLKQATARFLVESVRAGLYIKRHARQMSVPVMMMLAEIDEIVDNDSLVAFFQRVAAKKKVVKLYQGAYHTLEFEKDPLEFFRDMAHWLNGFTRPRTGG
jgi:alpha-beta hydrolase superfamily lysophospholipase